MNQENTNMGKSIELNEERWLDIDGYEGYYQVSNLGRVKTTYRSYIDKYCHGKCRVEKILSQSLSRSGYMVVNLSKSGKTKHLYVHRVVAIAFINNDLNKPQVNHIDGCKTNNTLTNLEWSTRSENISHAYENGLITPNRSQLGRVGGLSARGKAILQFDKRMNLINEFCTAREAAKSIGCDPSGITVCANGKYKYARGYVWRWKNEV